MSAEIITAVLSGFVTALVIEIYKQANERKKDLEVRRLEHNKQLHAFLEYDETLRQVRPVARLLISSHCQQMPLGKVPKSSQKITSIQEIKIPIVAVDEILKDEKTAEQSKPPLEYFTLHRTYHRVLLDRNDFAQVWTKRSKVEIIGAVTILGRSANSDIVLDSNLVSRLHAVIRYENENFVLYNMSTSNRILANDQEVSFQHVLQDGDILEFEGSYIVEFEKKLPTTQKTG